MTAAALALVLAAAFLHAGWNFLAKRAGAGGVPFVWLCATASTALWTPAALFVLLRSQPHIGWEQLGFMAGSGFLHSAYFTTLQRGYREGDLSLVYPLARGTGPLLSSAAAVAFLGERPGAQVLAGGAVICLGVFAIARSSGTAERSRMSAGLAYGLMTGVLIASYTLWDKHAVDALAIPAILYDWSSNAGRVIVLGPFALRRRAELRPLWVRHRREIIGIAVLAPLAYILVLTALAASNVSYVAPAREVSILIGAFLGARVLGEGSVRARMLGSVLIIGGLLALATG